MRCTVKKGLWKIHVSQLVVKLSGLLKILQDRIDVVESFNDLRPLLGSCGVDREGSNGECVPL